MLSATTDPRNKPLLHFNPQLYQPFQINRFGTMEGVIARRLEDSITMVVMEANREFLNGFGEPDGF